MEQRHYIALIHKDPDSGYGVSFPDVPGVVTIGDTLDQALAEASIVLAFAFEDWAGPLPQPRDLETLRADADFIAASHGAVIAAVRPESPVFEAAQ